MSNIVRPLSPHISIYRKQVTSVLSILHRLTGVALYLGLVLFAVFLCIVAYSPESYAKLHECFSSFLGRLVLFGWTFSFYFHFFNGIRHLFWDMGKGLDIHMVNKTGWFAAIFSLLASLLSWVVIYNDTGLL